ncbi:TPA: VacJ family lipoprotein [Yersinia enterocolitica]|nr:VacJ family lipoprotein [Yersinia enterocolitica]
MKTIQSLVLTAIALATSACASNAVKQQPAAASSEAQPTYWALVASSTEARQPATPTEPLPLQTESPAAHLSSRDGDRDGHAHVAVAGHNSQAARNGSSAQASIDSAHPTATITQAEQDAEDLYGTPPVSDPWEGFNRKMHGFNNVLDRLVLRPVAAGYEKAIPDSVQSGVSRFFTNLGLPATALNQAMQGRPAHAGQSLGRFLVNSTVGIAGVFDPATHFDIPRRDGEDFGQTLATWGWRDSRYLVMPGLGPRTVRDAVAFVGDEQMALIARIDSSSVTDKLLIMQMVDGRARLLPLDQARKDAMDDYTFVREVWAQRRNRQIEQDLRSNRD